MITHIIDQLILESKSDKTSQSDKFKEFVKTSIFLILKKPYTPFLRRAMNCGTRKTGQLRQPTTSLHTWPIRSSDNA